MEIPIGSSLEAYFSDVVSRYRGVLFHAFQKEVSVRTSPSKHVDLKNASCQLVYRCVTIFLYLLFCTKVKYIYIARLIVLCFYQIRIFGVVGF